MCTPLGSLTCFLYSMYHVVLKHVTSETESLRSLLGGSEAEAADLREKARKEREELVTRLLNDKGR